jgi:nucleoside-diphosphate-sugar epimerase
MVLNNTAFALVAGMLIKVIITEAFARRILPTSYRACSKSKVTLSSNMSSTSSFGGNAMNSNSRAAVYGKPTESKGNILLLGGSGFLGSAIAKRALLEGYEVTSISRRGKQNQQSDGDDILGKVKYIQGDARDAETIKQELSIALEKSRPYTAIIHTIGLLLDGKSGLGRYNQFASGSGSLPDPDSTYDDITRKTAFNALEAAENIETSESFSKTEEFGKKGRPLPFVFISAAEAGWPDMTGGSFIENYLAPEWLRRYLVAKRSVEDRLIRAKDTIRPVIFRPSLIFSFDRLMSLAPVGAFFLGNKIGLPFVDRPVTVQALAAAVVRSLEDDSVRGVQRYREIDALGSR